MVVQGSTPCLAEVDPATNEIRPSPVALAAIPFDQAEPDIGPEINEV